MKRWGKRMMYVAAGLVFLVTLAIVVERARGELALSSRLRALATQGETLSLAALKPKRAPDGENLFLDLLSLTNQLKTIATNLDSISPRMQFAAPGRAVVASQVESWPFDGKTTNDWDRIGKVLAAAREPLSALESAAQKRTYDSGTDYDKGFIDLQLKNIGDIRYGSQLLSWSVLYSLREGNAERAQMVLETLVRLTARQTPEPLIICQLVRHACAAMAFNVTWQALQIDGWTDARLAAMQTAWRECDFVKDMGFATEMERAMNLDFYTQLRKSKAKLDFVIEQREKVREITDGSFGGLGSQGFVLNWLHVPLWRAAWIAQDELEALERWQFTIQRERLARTNGWAMLNRTGNAAAARQKSLFVDRDKMGWYDRLRFLFASGEFAITDGMIRKTLAAQTQQQMTLTVLAIQRYRLRNGRPPAQLSELVPEFLAAPPRDFMDGQTLRYSLRPNHAGFLLYSVGEDGLDDGGDPTPRDGKKEFRQIWDGRDAVWPTAATAEEAKSAMEAELKREHK